MREATIFFLVDLVARQQADLGGRSSKELFLRRHARSGTEARASASRTPPPRRVPVVWLGVGAGAVQLGRGVAISTLYRDEL